MAKAISEKSVNIWIRKYVKACRSYDEADIAALFTDDAECHEWPYATAWIGREQIVAGWLERKDWQADGWELLGRFSNLWTVTFDRDRCALFRTCNNEL